MISYHNVVMNFSMNEYVSRCIGSHKSHTDEVKMHCSQVRLMFVFWKELFSAFFFFFPPQLTASTINIVLYENDW